MQVQLKVFVNLFAQRSAILKIRRTNRTTVKNVHYLRYNYFAILFGHTQRLDQHRIENRRQADICVYPVMWKLLSCLIDQLATRCLSVFAICPPGPCTSRKLSVNHTPATLPPSRDLFRNMRRVDFELIPFNSVHTSHLSRFI